MAGNEQGTGKHPHKSAEDPRPHHEGKTTKEQSAHEKGSSGHQHEQGNEPGEKRQQTAGKSNSDDLKAREYRDEQGNVHHHTHTSSEQHKGKK